MSSLRIATADLGKGFRMNLFISADKIGTKTGGGLVCYHESEALKKLGPTRILDQRDPTPFKGDEYLASSLCTESSMRAIAHFYSGSFPLSVRRLKSLGWAVTYTCAAHDKDVSREEHEKLGLAFPYPHLTEPALLWERYSECYRIADVLVCPSQAAKRICERYGCKNRIEVIPHGCEMPVSMVDVCSSGFMAVNSGFRQDSPTYNPYFPETFRVGYLGAVGPDKGLRYLFEAWKILSQDFNFAGDSVLTIAGQESTSEFVRYLWTRFGGGNVVFAGWQESVSAFYGSQSLIVQPSATEGFGIEVVEAMAHGRPVVVSDGAGAVDCVEAGVTGMVSIARDANDLAKCIKYYHDNPDILRGAGKLARKAAEAFTWDKVRAKYVDLWKGLLA